MSIAISCMLDMSGNGGLSFTCVRGLLISVFISHLNPALPYPNLGFICDISFAFVTVIHFTTCFYGCIFRSKLLPMPCTSGNFIPVDFALGHVCTKCLSEFPIL